MSSEDKLDRIFRLQEEYNQIVFQRDQRFLTENPSMEDKISAICRAIIHEAVELDRETSWKWWKRPKHFQRTKAKEELIDLQHFIIQAALVLGMDAEEFVQDYELKNRTNRERQFNGY